MSGNVSLLKLSNSHYLHLISSVYNLEAYIVNIQTFVLIILCGP